MYKCAVAVLGTCVAFPTIAAGQMGSVAFGRFHDVYYDWNNVEELAQGDTLRVRRVVYNGGAANFKLSANLCDIEFRTEAALRLVATDCSSGTLIVSGDSAWAEMNWVVEAPAGRYAYELRRNDVVLISGHWNVLSSRISKRSAPRPILPIVLEVHEESEHKVVPIPALETLIRNATRGTGYLPVITDQAAAEKLSGGMWYPRFAIRVGVNESYELENCWLRAATPLPRLCKKDSGQASAFMLGIFVRELVTQELGRLNSFSK